MKNILFAAMLFLTLIGTGCLNVDLMEPEIIVEPPVQVFVSRDTISAGEYLGIAVDANVENVYPSLQNLQETKGIMYVNVVSNIFSNVNQLNTRLHLYQSIFLDEQKGTDSGIQISFEGGKVKSIYLNSGKQLAQWPLKENASTSVRVGDQVDALHIKLEKIQSMESYANKFERISLFTKELASQYDPIMTQSPQWYFRYVVEPGLYEHVNIYIEKGKVRYLEVSRYRDPS